MGDAARAHVTTGWDVIAERTIAAIARQEAPA
jgi:hypothetical protein